MSKAKKVQSSSQQRTLWQETWRRFKKNKLAVAGMIFLIALVVIAIATIIIDAVNPSIYETYVIKQNLRERLAPPSAAHIFGQDEFGRDMLMRILWSIRSSLFMGALRRLRNATSRINTAFFVTYKQITPHRIWYNRVD